MPLDAADLNLLDGRIKSTVREVKDDFIREITSIKGDMLGRVSTLSTQMIAEFKIVHDRLGEHKRSLDTELARLRIELETEKIATAKALTTLATKPCSDVRLHIANEHSPAVLETRRDRSGGWSLLRDIAMIVTMVGVVYGLLKDSFVTPRDLLPRNPIVVNGNTPPRPGP